MININHQNLKELLAPAGNHSSFMAAINAGAQAIYMGLEKFNARVMADNFTLKEYIDLIDYAHKRNVRVYLTFNTLFLDNEIKEGIETLYELYKAGLDAVIVQDIGMLDVIRKTMPDLPIHASTQMSVHTIEQIKELEKLGVKRVVLARELSIKEIKEIRKNTNVELEVFVHGALCVSVSGQCLMSALIGNRSANRGNCAGTCRKEYSLYNVDGKKVMERKYLLSKKDIFGLDKVNELAKIGIDSFKIEGRNRTPEYVAKVVSEYNKVLYNNETNYDEKGVLQLFNRSGKSSGYLDKVRYRKDISEDTPKNTGLYLGKIMDVKKDYVKVKLNENINLHDGVEIISKSSTIVTCIRDENFNIVNKEMKKGSICWLGDIKNKAVGDKIYKTSDSVLNKELSKYIHSDLKKQKYNILVVIKENENIKVFVNDEVVEMDYIPQNSIKKELTSETVIEAFDKTMDTSLKFVTKVDLDKNLFVPISVLNDLRKKTVLFLENKKIVRREINKFNLKLDNVLSETNKYIEKNNKQKSRNVLYVYRYKKDVNYVEYYLKKYNKELECLYINSWDFIKYEQDILKYINKCKVYFAIPNVTLQNETKYILGNLEKFVREGIKGVVIGNVGYFDICRKLKEKYNIELVGDYSLNVTNIYSAKVYKKLGIDVITPLFENEDIKIDDISNIMSVELVEDLATVMTMRYCMISSFVTNSTTENICKKECLKNDYYLVDSENKRYDIVTDNMDCIVRLVRNKKKYDDSLKEKSRTRHCTI